MDFNEYLQTYRSINAHKYDLLDTLREADSEAKMELLQELHIHIEVLNEMAERMRKEGREIDEPTAEMIEVPAAIE